MPPKCGYRASLINAYHGRIFGAPDLHGTVTVAVTYGRTTVDTATVRSPSFELELAQRICLYLFDNYDLRILIAA